MIRLYSGTYFSVSGLASAIPLSISGRTPSGRSRTSSRRSLLRPSAAQASATRSNMIVDGDRPRVQGPDVVPRRRPGRAWRSSPWSPRPVPGRGGRLRIAAPASSPSASARSSSSTAGWSASSRVLSPRSEFPRSWMPSIAARSIAITSSAVSSVSSAATAPARRNPAPHSGPEVPPTRLVITTAIFFRNVPMSSRSKASKSATTARSRADRVPEVAVAHDRVQLAEVLLVVDRGLRDRPYDQLDTQSSSPPSTPPRSLIVRTRFRPRDTPAGLRGRRSPPAWGCPPIGQHLGALPVRLPERRDDEDRVGEVLVPV